VQVLALEEEEAVAAEEAVGGLEGGAAVILRVEFGVVGCDVRAESSELGGVDQLIGAA
jgi:hypothetical protein